jgi:hypothetical protein
MSRGPVLRLHLRASNSIPRHLHAFAASNCTVTDAWLIKTKTELKQGFLGSTRSKYYHHRGKHEIFISARLCMLNERRASQFRRVIDDYQQKIITKIEFTE